MFISKATSAIATSLENYRKEGKADREKLTTGESEVQNQLSNASQTLPNTSQATSSLTPRLAGCNPQANLLGWESLGGSSDGIPSISQLMCSSAGSLCATLPAPAYKGKDLAKICSEVLWKLQTENEPEPLSLKCEQSNKGKGQVEISQVFLKDTLKSATYG